MKRPLPIVLIGTIIVTLGFLLYQNSSPQAKTVGEHPPKAPLAKGYSAAASPQGAGHHNPQTSTTEEQKRMAQRKSLEEGLKLYKQGAFARTYARLEPVLRQSGLSAAEIDSAISSYVSVIFTNTKEERDAKIQAMKEQFGPEVYEGIENAEEAYRDRVRDDQLLAGLKAGLPSVKDADVSAATAAFPQLPNFNTLYMEHVKYQPASIDVRENMQSVAGAAFDRAFAHSSISANAREQLRNTYINIALSMTPSRK